MAVTIAEHPKSRSESKAYGENNADQAEMFYKVFGTEDDAVVRTLVEATLAPEYSFLTLLNYHLTPMGGGEWEVRAVYGEAPHTTLSFDTSGGHIHLQYSKETVQSWAVSPDGTDAAPPDFGQAVGATKDNIEGVDVVHPQLNFTLTKAFLNTNMPPAYGDKLVNCTGKTNDRDLNLNVDGLEFSFKQGELLCMGGSGDTRGDYWVFPIKFSVMRNTTATDELRIGGAAGAGGIPSGPDNWIEKKGWEYLWVRFDERPDTTSLRIVIRPQAVYVERLYDAADFSVLELPFTEPTPPTP